MLFKLCSCALIAVVCSVALKSTAKNFAVIFAAFSSVLILGAVIARFSGAIKAVSLMMNESGAKTYGAIMLKALGIGIIVNTVSSICRDVGESSLGNGVELAGKIEILLICLPIIAETLSLIKELLS